MKLFCIAICVVGSLVMSAPALAAPISIDFESGANVGDQITNQYATPSGVPEGPTFMAPASAGFTPFGCGAGHLSNATSHSGSNSVVLDGCAGGGEFSPTATFFSMGYTTDSVSFWIAVGAQIFNGSSDTVVTTAFDSNHTRIGQVVTTLGPQSGPTFQQVTIASTSFNIAFVSVELGSAGTNSSSPSGVTDTTADLNSAPLYLDDLTYDPPATPPGSSFVLGATPGATSTTDGAQAHITIPITWFNNPNPSADPVSLSAQTPTGVTASFSPNPSTTGTSTLTLTVSKTAPLGQWNVLVSGTSGSETEQVGIPFGISAAFQPAGPGAVTVLPCSSKQVKLTVGTGLGFSQPITLSVDTSHQPGVFITGISGSGGSGTVSDPSHASITVTPSGGSATATLSLLAAAGGAGTMDSPRPILLDAASSGYADQTDSSSTLAVGTSQVSTVYSGTSPVRTPQVLQAGTPVTITGQGFCPTSTVQFGNAKAIAVPSSATSTTIQVNVPRLATNGPVSVLTGSPAVAGPASAQTLNVDSYRNTNGWAFQNYIPSGFDLGELSDLFGVNNVYFTIDVCWPFGCNVPLFPTPTSGILLAVADGVLANSSTGGACFGFSLSTQRILEGIKPLYVFNPSGSTINSVDGPSGPSSYTQRFINTQALAQFSRNYIDEYLNANIGQAGSATSAVDLVRSEVAGVLGHGRYPLIALHDSSSGGGHLVIGYDVEDIGPHEYYIDVYDSNMPFGWTGSSTQPSAELALDGGLHQSNVQSSRIHVMPDGSWSLPSTSFSGHQTDIVVSDPASIPAQPAMPDALPGSVIYFGSAGAVGTGSTSAPAPPSRTVQLTGAGGRTLYGSGGQLNSDPATRLDAAPFAPAVGGRAARPEMFVLGRGAGALRQTIVGTASGADSYTLLGSGTVAQIDTHISRGVSDQLALAPSANTIAFSTGSAHAPVTLMLSGSSGGAVHTVTLTTTSFQGASDALSFNASRTGVTFVHHGGATTFQVQLSSLQHNGGVASFVSGPLAIGAGQSAQISRVRWSNLAGSTLSVRIGGRTVTVANRLHAARLARISSLRLVRGRRSAETLTISAKLSRLPRGATVALLWLIRSGGRIVANHTLALTNGVRGKLTRSWTFRPRRGRRYELIARVVVIAPSGVAGVSSSTASAMAGFAGR